MVTSRGIKPGGAGGTNEGVVPEEVASKPSEDEDNDNGETGTGSDDEDDDSENCENMKAKRNGGRA